MSLCTVRWTECQRFLIKLFLYYDFTALISRTSSTSNTRSVSAAVSNESVAGDSGVFEIRAIMPNKESAQVQIALKYLKNECILHVTIERARNLTALCPPENSYM